MQHDDAMARLRAALDRIRARAHHQPIPDAHSPALPAPTTTNPPPRPWCETDREPGEEG